jgi:hypothetical protein
MEIPTGRLTYLLCPPCHYSNSKVDCIGNGSVEISGTNNSLEHSISEVARANFVDTCCRLMS